jgi:hypothetical protein
MLVDRGLEQEEQGDVKMNVERLHIIAKAIKKDLVDTNSLAMIAQLVTSLQNQINQPQQPQYQSQTSQTVTALYNALIATRSNEFPPTWKQVVEEIGANEVLGNDLKLKIEHIFSRNQITPSVALQEIQEVHVKLQTLTTSVDQLLAALNNFHIGSEELKQGECEVGFIVPREFVNNRLDKFADELSELDKIFETLAELATGSRPGFNVKTISSSDLTVFFDAAPSVAACIAVAIERIVALYKQLLEIRKLNNELAKQGVTKEELVGVENHANNLMETGIEKLIDELITEYGKQIEKGRKHELEIALRFSLKKMANRIDRGFNVEVRAEPIKEGEKAEGTETESEANEIHHAKITQAAKTLQFMKLDGSPILSLNESATDEATKTKAKK